MSFQKVYFLVWIFIKEKTSLTNFENSTVIGSLDSQTGRYFVGKISLNFSLCNMAVNGKVKRIDLDDLIQEFIQWQKVILRIFVLVKSCLYIFLFNFIR